MKKIFAIILFHFAFFQGYSQLMQASIGVGSQVNRVKIYLKSDVTQSPSTISSLQFNIGVEAAGITTAPTLTVLSSAFPSTVWQQNITYLEGGYWNYNLFTITSPLTPSFTANTEFEAMEIEFSNGLPTIGNVALVTLPDGGTVGVGNNALFLCTGTVKSNGLSNLYYARTGVTVNNQNSYDPAFVIAGTTMSTAQIIGVTLPVKFTGFSVSKKENDAVLNWQVESESSITDRYEVERSVNGVLFQKIATVAPKNNGSSTNSYDMTDNNISSVNSNGVLYYKIKQVDKDGKMIYSPIKNLRLNAKPLTAGVYPNPVKGTANLSIDLEKDADAIITISDAGGKQLQNISMQLFKGSNIKKINTASLATGSYLLKIQTATETKTISIVKSN